MSKTEHSEHWEIVGNPLLPKIKANTDTFKYLDDHYSLVIPMKSRTEVLNIGNKGGNE